MKYANVDVLGRTSVIH